MLKSLVKTTTTYNEQFLLHLFTRCKRDPVSVLLKPVPVGCSWWSTLSTNFNYMHEILSEKSQHFFLRKCLNSPLGRGSTGVTTGDVIGVRSSTGDVTSTRRGASRVPYAISCWRYNLWWRNFRIHSSNCCVDLAWKHFVIRKYVISGC